MVFTKRSRPADIGGPSALVEGNIHALPLGNAASLQSETGVDACIASIDGLQTLLGRVAETSACEIDNLIGELEILRQRLDADASRIQDDIARYAALNEQVTRMTRVSCETVENLPDAPSISPKVHNDVLSDTGERRAENA